MCHETSIHKQSRSRIKDMKDEGMKKLLTKVLDEFLDESQEKNDIETFLMEENGLWIISNLLKNIFSSQDFYASDLINEII